MEKKICKFSVQLWKFVANCLAINWISWFFFSVIDRQNLQFFLHDSQFFLQSFNKIHNFFPQLVVEICDFVSNNCLTKFMSFSVTYWWILQKIIKIYMEKNHILGKELKVQHSIFHYAGFSYFKCDSPNPTHYFKSCNFIYIYIYKH